MTPVPVTVAGLDLAAGRGTSELAVLHIPAGDARPSIDMASHRPVRSDDDFLAVLAAARPVVVAIDAPLTLPAPVAAAISPVGSPGVFGGSPYTRGAERDATWSRFGVRPLPVSFLGGLTFRAIALLPRLRGLLPDAAIIEVFPAATLRILGTDLHPANLPRLRKSTPAARDTAQRSLATHLLGIPDPDTTLLSADLLDALAAAFTAALYLRGATIAAGDPAEGQIILPDPTHVVR